MKNTMWRVSSCIRYIKDLEHALGQEFRLTRRLEGAKAEKAAVGLLFEKPGVVAWNAIWLLLVDCFPPMPSSRDEFRNADQIVGDQIEQKVAGDATNAAMLGLTQGAVLFAPAKDALDHRAA